MSKPKRGPADDPPIIQYWHNRNVPDDVAELIATFDEKNAERSHLLFDETSAEEFIAEHFSPLEIKAFRTCAVPAMQADYLRYCAAYILGGICVDADCFCVENLGSVLDGCSGRIFRRRSGGVINGFFAFKRSRHPFPKLAIDIATANINRRRSENVWAMTGPFVLSALLQFYEAGAFDTTTDRASRSELQGLVDAFQITIGDYARVVEAFEGVRVCPFDEVSTWISEADPPPRYKGQTHNKNAVNWVTPGVSIFRD